jgi:aspartate/methionine/tyrosine aminotransferase
MQPFVMERWQSHYENTVRYNLSDSGVHPLTLAELLDLAGAEGPALDTPLSYGQTNGTEALRERIAALYSGAGPEQVVVTNGSAEANFLAAWLLVRPGDTVAVLTPTYMQLPGLADGLGARVRQIPLREELGWQPDPGDVARCIDDGTRLVVVTNPQNPTGFRLDETSVAAVLGAAERIGAWVVSDEVYAGAEREGPETRSLFGHYERVIATGSLSKAYGLQGLRVGWVLAPADLAEELWGRKDYTTISPGLLTDTLATLALAEDVRPRLIERTRTIIRHAYEIVERWVDDVGCFQLVGHEAGAVCYPSYDLPIGSAELADRLRREKDVLVVPGAHFDMGKYIRVSLGVPPAELEPALGRIRELASDL